MVNEKYHLEAGWGETPDILHNELFEIAPEVYAYLMLLTDVITGDSAVFVNRRGRLGGRLDESRMVWSIQCKFHFGFFIQTPWLGICN